MTLRTLVSAALLLAAPAAFAAGAYVPGTEDVPLMPGLAALRGADLVFDKPQGRIVEAAAQGKVRRADVLAFYGQSLPALGWVAAGTQRFEREGEKLRIGFAGGDGDLTVDFSLAPL